MGELLLLSIIVTVVVLAIRRSKPVILDNPLVISRSGKYHITLAPPLNRVQNFVEIIVKQIGEIAPQSADSVTQYFAVYDATICPSGDKLYLLAVALRGGVLYFQAIMPQPLLHDSDSHLKTVSAFSALVLAHHPDTGSDPQNAQKIHAAVTAVAQMLQTKVAALTA